MNYEKIIIVGDIGSAEVLESAAGKKYIRMSVAANRGKGEARVTNWYSVLIYGSMAANVDALIRVFLKGRRVLVEGRPQSKAYLKRDGTAGMETSIHATALPVLLDAPPSEIK